MNDINHLLDTLQEGDPVAADQLLVLVYSELRRLAAAKMSRETPGLLLSRKALWSARTCPRFGAGGSLLPRAGCGRGGRARVPAGQTRPARTSPLPPQSADKSAQSKALRAKPRRADGWLLAARGGAGVACAA